MEKNSPIKKENVKIDDSTIRNKGVIKTTIKPSDAEIEEIKKLWEKFHSELLDRTNKDTEKK